MPRKRRTLIVTHKGCGACAAVRDALKEQLRSGEVEEVPVETANGQMIAALLELEEVPQCVEQDDNGDFKKCDIEKLLDKYGVD